MGIMVRVTDDDKAIIALVGRFGPHENRENSAVVLTPSEYNQIAAILFRNLEKTPADLWEPETRHDLAAAFPEISSDRIEALMSNRNVGLATHLREIEDMGLSVITRHNESYPKRIRTVLGPAAPPLLYVAGNPDLFGSSWVGIVGSRNADDQAHEFTRDFVRNAVDGGFGIVSGGARGIDDVALRASLEAGGTALAYLPGQMGRAIRNRIWREAIEENRALLACSVYPTTRFQVGNAMARNRLIYAQAEVTVVSSTDFETGGTWAGATEALRRGWGRVAVRHPVRSGDPRGHNALVDRGAIPITDPTERVWETTENTQKTHVSTGATPVQPELF